MNARISMTTALALPVLALALTVLSSSEPPRAEAAAGAPFENKFIGAAKCKSCHSAKETGDPYGTWSKSKHAGAFEVLQGAEAKELATAAGIADPAKADACVKCHVTGFGEPEDAFARGFKQNLGVQCETCHGRGEDHLKTRFKAAASGEKVTGYEPLPEGEIVVTPSVSVCVQCHNPESPNYDPFCYYEARAEIAHLDPRKPRTAEELADYGKCPDGGDPCTHAADGCPEGKCNLKPEELEALRK